MSRDDEPADAAPDDFGHDDFGHDDFGHEDDSRPAAEPVAAPAPRRAAPTRPKIPTVVAAAGAAVLVIGVLAGLLLWRFSGGSLPGQTEGPGDPTPSSTLTPRTGTPAPVQEAKVGQRTPILGLYGRGTVTVTRAEWSDSGDLPPGAGRKYLNVELRYDCTEGVLQLSKNQYAAYDLAKKEYLPGIGSGKDPLPDAEVQPGQPPTTGWISIELPPGQTLFVVSDEGINPLVIVDLPKP